MEPCAIIVTNQEDAVILDRYFNFGFVQLNRIREMKELGVADEKFLEDRYEYVKWHLGNEAGRRWWAQQKPEGPNEDYDLVNAILSTSDFQSNKRIIDPILMKPDPALQ
ncbi:MAG: hypothetical protein ACI9FB_004509 [Candidatus Azotimanducaceae bacterium]|jgi:hypothetical protein